jgi:hypothetical protein
MATSTEIPVAIEPEAAELIAELGLEATLQAILAHCRREVPRLRRIEVTYSIKHEDPDNPTVIVYCVVEPTVARVLEVDDALADWFLVGHPPEVVQHILVTAVHDHS